MQNAINKKTTSLLKVLKRIVNDFFKEPLFILTHPLKGFYEFKTEKKFKWHVAVFYLLLRLVYQVVAYNGEGFLVNTNAPGTFNSIEIISLILLPVVLITVGNWSITCFLNGKGTMLEIFYVICYSLCPFMLIKIPNLIYSNFLTLNEVSFYTAFNYIAVFLLVFMAFFGLMQIHEYGLVTNIASLALTVVAVAIIIFIVFLFFCLFQNFYAFISSLWNEFALKFL